MSKNNNFVHSTQVLGSKTVISRFENEDNKVSYSLGFGIITRTKWSTEDGKSTQWQSLGFGSTSKSGEFEAKTYVAFTTCPSGIVDEYNKATDKEKYQVALAEKMLKAGFSVIPVTSQSPIKDLATEKSIELGNTTLDEIASKQAVPNSDIYMKNYLRFPNEKVSERLALEFGREITKEDFHSEDGFKFQLMNPDLTYEVEQIPIEINSTVSEELGF